MLNKLFLTLFSLSAASIFFSQGALAADDFLNFDVGSPSEPSPEVTPGSTSTAAPTESVVEVPTVDIKQEVTAPEVLPQIQPEKPIKQQQPPIVSAPLTSAPLGEVMELAPAAPPAPAPVVEAAPSKEAKYLSPGKVVADFSDPKRSPKDEEQITENLIVSSPFGTREQPEPGASIFHRGIDIRHNDGPDKTKQMAAFIPGKPGDQVKTRTWYDDRGGGVVLDIEYLDRPGYMIRFLHLAKGTTIADGVHKWTPQLIGAMMGDTGIGAAHLHISEIQFSPSGERTDIPPGIAMSLSSVTGEPISNFLKNDGPPIGGPATPIKEEPKPQNKTAPTSNKEDNSYLFKGGADSLVAWAVGAAEGTRHPNGGKTKAFKGHVDPGNGVWNLGSFSYQHEANSPEEADEKQLKRLKRQFQEGLAIAERLGVKLNTKERKLNFIDLANQAPLAALDSGGFVYRLKEAEDKGMKGREAILWARVNSYKNPRTGVWEAPGLGNTLDSITHDQNRRMEMVQKGIDEWVKVNPNHSAQSQPESKPTPQAQAQAQAQPQVPTVNRSIDDALDSLFNIDL